MKAAKGIRFGYFILTLAAIMAVSGCTVIFQKGRRSDAETIEALKTHLDKLEDAKRLLAERLQKEIEDKEVKLEMAEKGLVITFVSDVLFDSGKAKIRPETYPSLDKVARVLNENLADYNIGIEGHTDNQPIKYSSWRSNWELSSARALSILHYLVDERSLFPTRVCAMGYGEYHPVASNDAKGGMQLNRRVEIVVLPKISKVRDKEDAQPANQEEQIQENSNLAEEPVQVQEIEPGTMENLK